MAISWLVVSILRFCKFIRMFAYSVKFSTFIFLSFLFLIYFFLDPNVFPLGEIEYFRFSNFGLYRLIFNLLLKSKVWIIFSFGTSVSNFLLGISCPNSSLMSSFDIDSSSYSTSSWISPVHSSSELALSGYYGAFIGLMLLL